MKAKRHEAQTTEVRRLYLSKCSDTGGFSYFVRPFSSFSDFCFTFSHFYFAFRRLTLTVCRQCTKFAHQ